MFFLQRIRFMPGILSKKIHQWIHLQHGLQHQRCFSTYIALLFQGNLAKLQYSKKSQKRFKPYGLIKRMNLSWDVAYPNTCSSTSPSWIFNFINQHVWDLLHPQKNICIHSSCANVLENEQKWRQVDYESLLLMSRICSTKKNGGVDPKKSKSSLDTVELKMTSLAWNPKKNGGLFGRWLPFDEFHLPKRRDRSSKGEILKWKPLDFAVACQCMFPLPAASGRRCWDGD